MTRQTQNAPAVPTQAQIDAAVARGRSLRSQALRDALNAFASVFTEAGGTRAPTALSNGAR